MSNITFDITPIVVALIGLLSTIVTCVLVPYFKSKTTEAQRENIYFWAKIAVNAAEKIFNDSGMGKEKKEYVKEFLAAHGIHLDESQVEVVIESAVKQMQDALAD